MSTLRMIIGVCLLVTPFAGAMVLIVALLGVVNTAVALVSAVVVVGCVYGGLELLDS